MRAHLRTRDESQRALEHAVQMAVLEARKDTWSKADVKERTAVSIKLFFIIILHMFTFLTSYVETWTINGCTINV